MAIHSTAAGIRPHPADTVKHTRHNDSSRQFPAISRHSLASYSLFCLLAILLFCVAALAQETVQAVSPTPRRGPSPEIQTYQHPDRVEIYRLRIVNDAHGEISGSRDGGQSWVTLGHVAAYTEKITNQGYTASKWAPTSAIAATAVNAIHISTGYNPKDDKGVVFSILPQEMTTDAGKKLQSFYSEDASIYTDIPGGTGIFGGHWSPILGNAVYLQQADGTLASIPANNSLHKGDILVIPVLRPLHPPKAIIFENRFGGLITLIGWDDAETLIGQVLKPVAGVGRFWGTQYTDIGRLRANHNGVIDISVAPFGQVGGLQIIPREHAMSPEMERARTFTQWMVVGPLDARDPSWEGIAPLFRDYLAPSWSADDLTAPDWRERLSSRLLVDCRIKNGPWQPLPSYSLNPDLNVPLPDWANAALASVTHLRILFPVPEPAVGATVPGQ